MSTCPTGFRPYPPSNNCYFLTERAWPPIVYNKAATSLAECIALCASHHGAPACLTSADEIKSAGLAAAEAPSIRTFSTINPGAVWIGNYRSTSGESICLDGTTTLPWPVAARPSRRMTSPTVPSCTKERSCLSSVPCSFESWACICEAGANHVLSASFLVRLGHGRSEATSAAVPELLRDRSLWRCCRRSSAACDARATAAQFHPMRMPPPFRRLRSRPPSCVLASSVHSVTADGSFSYCL